jgi:hypothetical protein
MQATGDQEQSGAMPYGADANGRPDPFAPPSSDATPRTLAPKPDAAGAALAAREAQGNERVAGVGPQSQQGTREAGLSIQQASGQQAGQQALGPTLSALMPWAMVAVLGGAALIAWALVSRRRRVPARAQVAVDHAGASRLAMTRVIDTGGSVLASAQPSDSTAQRGSQLVERLDARTQQLEKLIVLAEQRMAELEAMERRASLAAALAGGQARPGEDTARDVSRLSVPGMNPKAVQEARAALISAIGVADIHAEPKPDGTSPDPTLALVYELADAGLRPVEIAKKTGRPTGQVELILNLRRQMAG